ncbi:MAG: hypothetical protein NT154_09245 [Verrucomicrobia bacterium]|nr:hypothetical protein [Verrucomicrobiota bacterium]
MSRPASEAITVALASSDPPVMTVPPSVTVAAGAPSAMFQATVVEDLSLDGQWPDYRH